MKNLAMLLCIGSFGLFVYTTTTNPSRIPMLHFLGIDATDFDWNSTLQYSGNGRTNVERHYQDSVELWASYYDLPPEYLLSLIILECGGQHPCGKRFEPKRYKQLKNLRDGKRRKFEYLRQHDLAGLSDTDIRKLATSWGPFQIMGYHSIGLSKNGEHVSVADLTGPRAIEIGVRWVDENYGTLLRYGRYKDAFHMHNTGRVYPKLGKPKTHDPKYVPNGLSHMAYFSSDNSDESKEVLTDGDPAPVASSTPDGDQNEVRLIEMGEDESTQGETYNGWQVSQ